MIITLVIDTFNIGNNGTVAGNSVLFQGANSTTLNAGVTGNSATTTSAALNKAGTGTLTAQITR